MPESGNYITAIREDLAVFRAVLAAGIKPTSLVIESIWRWFHDIELIVPLGDMNLGAVERAELASQIVEEMDAVFAKLESQVELLAAEDLYDLRSGPEAEMVNNLWRELAGCYADMVNAVIPVLPTDLKEALEAEVVANLVQRFETDEDQVRFQVKTDGAIRMMIRLAGLDPDRALAA